MKLSCRIPFQLLLLCGVVLTLYYVTMFAEVCLLDDRDTIIGLFNTEYFDLKSIIIPHEAKGGYYRPLIVIFYMVDRFIWGLESRIMHFENILFHLLNVLVLYIAASELIKKEGGKSGYIPLLTALFFAVHPIATESVNWISGRTDLLAGIFLLIGTFLLIRYRKHQAWWFWPAISMCVLSGMSAKETAVAFVFVAFFLLNMKDWEYDGYIQEDGAYSWRGIPLLTAVFYTAAVLVALFIYNYLLVLLIVAGYGVALYYKDIGTSRREYLRFWAGIGVSLILAVTLFFIVRKLVFVSDIARIPNTLMLIKADPVYALKMFIGAIGFYVKKFLFPLPLNLAIREIDPLYELLGIGVILLAVLFVRIGGIVSSLALAGLCLITPALPLSLGTVAWTAYAERYIYLAIPFWVLAAVIGWQRAVTGNMRLQRAGYVVAGVFFAVWAVGTFERNLTWRTNLALFEDTVKKSPNFKVTRGLYMLALYENNRYDRALEQYRIASSLQSLEYDEKFDMLYALIRMKQGYPEEARSTYEKMVKKKETVAVLGGFLNYLTSMRDNMGRDDVKRQEIDKLVINLYERLYKKSGDALYLYRLGQEYLTNSKIIEAKNCFARAARELPESNHFKQHALKLSLKLQ